jgi:hypothetical protein
MIHTSEPLDSIILRAQLKGQLARDEFSGQGAARAARSLFPLQATVTTTGWQASMVNSRSGWFAVMMFQPTNLVFDWGCSRVGEAPFGDRSSVPLFLLSSHLSRY